MMTLDPQILSDAEAARVLVLERQHELERARADLNHEIRRLHAAGGSMREISDSLGVSHQRVHQIVTNGETVSDSLLRRLSGRLRRVADGAYARFADDARAVVQRGHEEAIEFGAAEIEPEHLLLALATPEAGVAARVLLGAGATHDALRAAVAKVTNVSPHRDPRAGRIPFSGASKKALELSLREALRRGDDHVGSEHVLLGLLRGDTGRISAVLDDVGTTAQDIRQALGSS